VQPGLSAIEGNYHFEPVAFQDEMFNLHILMADAFLQLLINS
jgi:hypothetical protein